MRSLLFVPAHDARKLAKGLDSGADALIIDLEDAVPEAEKPRARAMCSEFVAENRDRLPLIVRVNALNSGLLLDDLAAVVRTRPYAVMLPKCTGARDVSLVSTYLDALEARDGVSPGSIAVLPIATESAEAVLGMGSYAPLAGQRLCGLMWGGEDLAADVGTVSNRSSDGRYTAPYAMARSLTLMGATAAQVPAIDAVYTNFRDPGGLAAESEEAVRDGFSAKAAIHPDQIPVIHAAFTPAQADVDWARRVVAEFDASPGRGAISLDGRMLDRPHYRSAQRLLTRAGLQA
jgi:citrate lyase subunit beta / citryl-CoA lyase